MNREINDLIKKTWDEDKNIPQQVTVGWPSYDHKEIISVVDSLLQGRVSAGQKVQKFEEKFASYLGARFAVSCNSGSSANLLALQTLMEAGDIKRGDGVIVPASTFITVATPIVQLGLVPVFVDVELESYNLDPLEVEKAAEKAKAVIVVHSLGNPAKIEQIVKIARKFDLKIIEDCCEAHGASVNNKKVGSFGDLSTFSFFVAHNMTMGEGGIVGTNKSSYEKILRSLREFGRVEQTGERFQKNEKLGVYDRRYIFERLGYGLRLTEMQAAFGLEQLKKLDMMNKRRREIAHTYSNELSKYSQFLQLPVENGFHTYYTYQLLIKKDSNLKRSEITNYLESKGIETRPFFAGFIPDQPAFKNEKVITQGELITSRLLKDNAFFIGCHPKLGKNHIDLVLKSFDSFFKNRRLTAVGLVKSRPKISCIVVSFNKPIFLPQALDSVLNQTYQDFEIVLVDGGSTEAGMKELLEKYSLHPKIRFFYTGETKQDRDTKAMLSVSANLGIEKARGEIITYLCDDDIFLPKRFEKMVAYLEKNKEAKVVYSWQRAYNLDLQGKKTQIHFRKLMGKRGKRAQPYLPLDNFIDVNSFMHYRSCLKSLKKPYWPEKKETQGHNDGIFAEKLGEKFIFHPINQILDDHRYTPKSLNYQSVTSFRLGAKVLLSRFLWSKKGLKIDT